MRSRMNLKLSKSINRQQFYTALVTLSLPILVSSTAELKKADSILDLQESKVESSMSFPAGEDNSGSAKLINLNPNINISYLLELKTAGAGKYFNLHNPQPEVQKLSLDPVFPRGVTILGPNRVDRCELWDETGKSVLIAHMQKEKPYQGLCDDKIFLVIPTAGRSTTKEIVADFLRRNVWQGEQLTTIVKNTFFKDSFLQISEETQGASPSSPNAPIVRKGPEPGKINQRDANLLIKAKGLDLPIKGKENNDLPIGEWFGVIDHPGIFVSAIEPGRVADDILSSYPERVSKLDDVERKALVISVAYDLSQYDVGFILGTEHPSLNWSPRANGQVRPKGWLGPDGFAEGNPIVSAGMVPPNLTQTVVSTFTGGFKRYHSAFKYGPLSLVNRGSHYGFMEHGVLHSRLNPGLATLYIDSSGRIDMKTWTSEDDGRIPVIRNARQNGVPIVEWDETSRRGIPGAFVGNWGVGNWSGADNKTMRALRAGVCIQESNNQRYLIYGYFTSVTPTAMARVFQSYGCRYAMHLDMNALEHTYLAVYSRGEEGSSSHYLIDGMKVLDETGLGAYVPRFVGMPDNRDFFYILPKPKVKQE